MTAVPLRWAGPVRPGAESGPKESPPLSIYVHLPWCLRKCPYCDFNSHEWREGARTVPEEAYLDALQADLESSLPSIWGRSVQTVFIGGGTPSLFSAQSVARLLALIRSRVRLAPDAEITLEANPGTFEVERFTGYRDAGVTRLSIGVQSFSDRALAAIGRVHDATQARAAVDLARRVFESFNVDLMYALPGQSLEDLQADLDEAIGRGAPHLSCYHLTLEPGTAFAKRPPVLPDDDLAADMQGAVEAACLRAGLRRYEISAFALPGHRCRHNLNYWEFGDYLGIGAGAHGKLSFSRRIVRQSRLRHPLRYMEALAGASNGLDAGPPDPADAAMIAAAWMEEVRSVGAQDLPFEFMLNALRLTEGVPVSSFANRTGLTEMAIAPARLRAEARSLLVADDPARLRPTELGLRFLSDLQGMFLPG